jgi:hypothetical protein
MDLSTTYHCILHPRIGPDRTELTRTPVDPPLLLSLFLNLCNASAYYHFQVFYLSPLRMRELDRICLYSYVGCMPLLLD